MYTLVLSRKFQKELEKTVKDNPKLKPQISKTLRLLLSDLKHPSLRLHKLSGQNNWAVSATKSLRIILRLEEDELYLLRIGKHEDVY